MIRGRLSAFERLCKERGYDMNAVSACIVSRDGDMIVVDEKHASYPSAKDSKNSAVFKDVPGRPFATTLNSGPGTELKSLLSRIGIASTPTCSCNARAHIMDAKESSEPGWCERNINLIVGWLREEAEKRGLPFIDAAGRLLVRRAIANAKRKAASS